MNDKLRDELLIIAGLLQAICFPLATGIENQGYYDLIQMTSDRYEKVLEQLIDYKE